MNSDDFKNQFQRYRLGTLSEEEEEEMENELEKLDAYQSFLETEMDDTPKNNYYPNMENKILKHSQFFAYFRIGIVSVVVSLLLLPTLNFIAMAFNIFP